MVSIKAIMTLLVILFFLSFFPSQYINLLYEDANGKIIEHGEPIHINTDYFAYLDESMIIERGEIFYYFFDKFFKSGLYDIYFKNNSSLLFDDGTSGKIRLNLIIDEEKISLDSKEEKKIDRWKVGKKHKLKISTLTFYDTPMKTGAEGTVVISKSFRAKKSYPDFILRVIGIMILWFATLSSINGGIRWIKSPKLIV